MRNAERERLTEIRDRLAEATERLDALYRKIHTEEPIIESDRRALLMAKGDVLLARMDASDMLWKDQNRKAGTRKWALGEVTWNESRSMDRGLEITDVTVNS